MGLGGSGQGRASLWPVPSFPCCSPTGSLVRPVLTAPHLPGSVFSRQCPPPLHSQGCCLVYDLITPYLNYFNRLLTRLFLLLLFYFLVHCFFVTVHRLSLVAADGGLLFAAVCRLLTAVASLPEEL